MQSQLKDRHFVYSSDKIYLRCLTDECDNLIKGKTYVAVAQAKSGLMFTDYVLKDEENHIYIIQVMRDLVKRRFELLEGDK